MDHVERFRDRCSSRLRLGLGQDRRHQVAWKPARFRGERRRHRRPLKASGLNPLARHPPHQPGRRGAGPARCRRRGPVLRTAGRRQDPNYDNNVALVSIKTDQNGVIENVGYGMNGTARSAKGCGAKIANLPQLVEALQLNKTIDLAVEDKCLKGVTVHKP